MSHLFLCMHTCIGPAGSNNREFFAKQLFNGGLDRALARDLGRAALGVSLALPTVELTAVVGEVQPHSVPFWSATAKLQ